MGKYYRGLLTGVAMLASASSVQADDLSSQPNAPVCNVHGYGADLVNIGGVGKGYVGQAKVSTNGQLITADILTDDNAQIHVTGHVVGDIRSLIVFDNINITTPIGGIVNIRPDRAGAETGTIETQGSTHYLLLHQNLGALPDPTATRVDLAITALNAARDHTLNCREPEAAVADSGTSQTNVSASVNTAQSRAERAIVEGYQGGEVDRDSIRDNVTKPVNSSNVAIQDLRYRSRDAEGRWHDIHANITYMFDSDSTRVAVTGSDQSGSTASTFEGNGTVLFTGPPLQHLHIRSLGGNIQEIPIAYKDNVPAQYVFMAENIQAGAGEIRSAFDNNVGLEKNYTVRSLEDGVNRTLKSLGIDLSPQRNAPPPPSPLPSPSV